MTGCGGAGAPAGDGDVDPGRFRDVLAHFASGVTITTTRDADGTPYGMTVSAFCSVSLSPPLVGVCLARSARCHPVFAVRDRFTVNVLRQEHLELAARFGRRGEDKFREGRFRCTDSGMIAVQGALAVLDCTVHSRHEAGDHTILVGEVRRAELDPGEPLVVFGRRFQRLAEALP